jgi:hypothetical protein
MQYNHISLCVYSSVMAVAKGATMTVHDTALFIWVRFTLSYDVPAQATIDYIIS